MGEIFNQRDWKERKGYLGHTSEMAFETFCKKEGILFERFGQRTESSLDYKNLSIILRMRPDYICQKVDESFFVEVKSVGRDGILKVKLESLEGITFWDSLLPVKIFIYDSVKKRVSFFAYKWLRVKLYHVDIDRFESDLKPYFPLSIREFAWHELKQN